MSDKLTHLLPCPFCGCTKAPKRQGNGIGDYWLECFECGASTRLREDGAGNEKDWNRRASSAPAISESDDALLTAARRAIPALAHAAERNPAYQRDYEELSKAIEDAARKGGGC
ncbi:Lar family restriction alleviation protein [Burkholderia gladioli]|uniref:Lar family restriction alleviation protein n=1 Tax=Burkholderia gladioli TaxID=28095 RepID=UPI001C23CF67|nr:Lar family restriction alleviation protein [Burkholderia gladioli]MBU9643740.1 Lar family restriction alleviation protein [Burkholderia gladioli]